MSNINLQYKPFGERSILIEWPQYISEKTLKSVLLYKNELENHYIKDNVYIKSAYNSILITYNVRINNFYDEILVLKTLSLSHKDELNTSCKLWKIPVCYDQSFGIDLEEISEGNNLSIPDIIERHSSKNYHVYFIGFLPGFLYLGGLDKRLHVPRKSNPRLKVAKGSVARISLGCCQAPPSQRCTSHVAKVSIPSWNLFQAMRVVTLSRRLWKLL